MTMLAIPGACGEFVSADLLCRNTLAVMVRHIIDKAAVVEIWFTLGFRWGKGKLPALPLGSFKRLSTKLL
jgi:hypothetical protein